MIADIIAYTEQNSNLSGFSMSGGYWFIAIVSMVLSMGASWMLRRRFAQFSRIPTSMTGEEVAKRMLQQNGIVNVRVTCVEGSLTDHYNPSNRTVNLSRDVFYGNNIAAAAVAAHECGHAIQHAQSYAMLGLRSMLVPMVSLSSNLVQWVIAIGMIMIASGGSPFVLGIGVVLFAVTTLFAFVTLPVEFDASRRALAWINSPQSGDAMMHSDKARSALFWAASTYVIAALASLAHLLYYLQIFLGARRNDD